MAKFKTSDIEELNTEAVQYSFGSTAGTAVGNATTSGKYLATAGGGAKQITSLGERLVRALPDREAIKAVHKDAVPETAEPVERRLPRKNDVCEQPFERELPLQFPWT